jgi:uncharacterized phage protein (TIGR02220 family)
MAGEWIKLDAWIFDKPEVLRLSRLLGEDVHAVVGSLVFFWIWLDRHSVDGTVDGVTSSDVDAVANREGFAEAMAAVGWLRFDDKNERIEVPNFDAHNGETAKKRALKNDRQARWRASSTGASTREEKRREEVRPKALSDSPPATADVVSLPRKTTELREQAKDLLAFLNDRTSRHFRDSAANLDPLIARLKEGVSPGEVRAVMARKIREWGTDEKMAKYLRPETLFNRTKFHQYLGEVPPPEPVHAA